MKKGLAVILSIVMIFSSFLGLFDVHAAVSPNMMLAEYFGEFRLSDNQDIVAVFDELGETLIISGYGDLSRERWLEMILKITQFDHPSWDSDDMSTEELIWEDVKYDFDIKFEAEEPGDTIVFPKDCTAMFSGLENSNIDFGDCVDTSKVQTMESMFCDNYQFDNPVNFDTSNVKNMRYMFANCSNFNQPVDFDTSKVTDTSGMFFGCTIFNQPVNFDMRKVEDARYMFEDAEAFDQNIDFDLASVRNIEDMFKYTKLGEEAEYVILRTGENNVEAEDVFKYIGSYTYAYLSFRGLKDVELYSPNFDSDVYIVTEGTKKGMTFPQGQDSVVDCISNEHYKAFFIDEPHDGITCDRELVVGKDEEYSVRDIKNKTCEFFGRELEGDWEIAEINDYINGEQTGYNEWVKLYFEEAMNEGKKLLVFTPKDPYLPMYFESIAIKVVDKTVSIESDDTITINEGETYSEDSIANKKAVANGQELAGEWNLTPKNAHRPGEYNIKLSFKPDDKSYKPVFKEIKLIILGEKEPLKITADKKLVIQEGDSYSVDDIKNKKATAGSKVVDGVWSLSDTSIKTAGTHKIELIFTPNSSDYKETRIEIDLEIQNKALKITADKKLVIKEGDSYSVEDIKNKKATAGSKVVDGVWSLSDTSIKTAGTHKIELIFTPNSSAYKETRIEIDLEILKKEGSGANSNEMKPMQFNDVKEGDWYKPGVDFVSSRGIMNGTAPRVFAPNGKITKAMLATMLKRLSGDNDVTTNVALSDVKKGDWYYESANWSVAKKIANVSAGKFEPNHELTREEFIIMLYKYAEYLKYDTSKKADLSSFNDLSKLSTLGKKAMEWAVEAGIINGISATEISPDTGATRAQMATIFMRFMKKYAEN